jgi:hypothetical protein
MKGNYYVPDDEENFIQGSRLFHGWVVMMRDMIDKFFHRRLPVAALFTALIFASVAPAATNTNVFFNVAQTMTVVSSNLTTITINSSGYLFTYSQDGYFTGGVGLTNPVGRFFSVLWPDGIDAQAYTAGPLVGKGANITIKRADGKKFNLQSFTGKILLNTAGAGAAFEIMPQLNGNDAFADPLMYDCSGYAGMSFPYTPALAGYDTYAIHMWGDFALTALTLMDTNPIAPPAPTNTITASASPIGAGMVGGAGDYASNSVCSLTASPNPGWGFKNWTLNGAQVSTSANYNFTVRSNRTLVANFVSAYTVTTAASPLYGGSPTGGGTFNSNATVTVKAAPASGFQFVNWTDYGNPVSTATNYSFTLTADHALVANYVPLPQTAVFDFDTGYPAVAVYQGMPASQSNRQVTAYFSPVSGGWSIQNQQTSVIGVNPAFSGNMLYPSTWGSAVQIQFSEPLTDIALDFTTGEISSEYNTAATMRVTAYTNSVATPAVGSGTSQGSWISGAYPEGHLAFHSATPFTIVTIDVAPVGVPSGLFFADNIVAQRVIPQSFAVSATVVSTNAGFVSGAGDYLSGTTASLLATPNLGFIFSDWSENGNIVSYTPDYSFTVSTNTALVANFITNTPPLAFGGNFFQLPGQPLAINISDLMWNDYDPDGLPVYFTGVNATTANGLALTNDGLQIFISANSVADSFIYTISDGNGGSATGTGNIGITNSAAGRALSLNAVAVLGSTTVNFSGVPWYYYEIQRATNAGFSGTLQIWPVQAAPDGSIILTDDFLDLGGKPPQGFYRLKFVP